MKEVFQTIALRMRNSRNQKTVERIGMYTKYLLKEGTLIEKRELLGCLQSKLFLKDKKVTME